MKSQLASEEQRLVDAAIDKNDLVGLQNHLELLKAKYRLQGKEIKIYLQEKVEDALPSSIFTRELGVNEAIVKFLKENKAMSNKEIAELMKKSENNIAVTYYKARAKQKEIFTDLDYTHAVPIKALRQKEFTSIEAVVVHYKKELGLRFSQIAKIMNRDDRTIWTIYNRCQKKT
ncbi:hypothetical protein KY320_02670 [Candidatus Woesearchaeota archaeon]|nr:hypothetical protein [Candidatus Woesearchaeota archaeon]